MTQATGPAGSSFTTGTLTYAYDAGGELTSVTGAETYTYSFDSNGNRNSTGYTTGTGNQMTHDGSSDTFTYGLPQKFCYSVGLFRRIITDVCQMWHVAQLLR